MAGNWMLKERVRRAYSGEEPWLNTDELAAPFSLKKPSVIGVQFMGDLFHESLTNEQIAAVFGVMAATPQHQYIVLTKRVDRAFEWFEAINDVDRTFMLQSCYRCLFNIGGIETNEDYHPWPLPNVIMCASVEDQWSADERVPLLLQIPAAYHGVSVEPMLELVDFTSLPFGKMGNRILNAFTAGSKSETPWVLDLVICGAETGQGKRLFKDDWAVDLVGQCYDAGVPFFFKKDGAGNGKLCGVEYHEWIIG